MNARIEPKESIREFVYRKIRNQIINWELKPGQKLSEKEISDTLSVSRTPVREAFIHLSQEELLHIYPQIGTVVSKINISQVEEARFIRVHIERAIVKNLCKGVSEDFIFNMESNLMMQSLCVEKNSNRRIFELDEEYHKLFYQEDKKLRTWLFVRKMNGNFDRLRALRLASDTNWEQIVQHHQEIFKRILAKDPIGADKIMTEHLELVNLEKGDIASKFPEYFI
ncbi:MULTISPECIES: GntR family transcriptional regulator [Bacillaceae]|uniref:GntR family transcriptional regulator n=1 Tax=Evansella alkalicola TaxID=745819 RepID=A0ABS6JXQ4_9BACI|nr:MULTISPECIES: GntR family transcriptional regulator [Bacillaceae]MBU9723364.1 GntR family transcriptional regulator [Bacillus alkalicola]